MIRGVAIVVLLGILATMTGAVFVVRESEQVIKTQFGKPVGDPITTPGLHVKMPFVQRVHVFDKRFLEWDGDATELPTKDKRFIFVDTYARWRISDPLLFFQRLQNERRAQSRLDDIIDGETRNAIAKHNLVEVVRSTNRDVEIDETDADLVTTSLEPIRFGREAIRQEILTAAQSRTGDLGIEILDVQIKRINYVAKVREKVYDRMVAERQRIADRYRSEGEGEAARIRGEMDRELKSIESEAFREAEQIRGRADARAIEIYARAYDQSADSRRFYEFLRSMEVLAATASEDTTIVLSTDGELYRYLDDSNP